MTSVEKRRSGRKGHRKHSDGGYSDTSSGGSFLDETDREVSSLTDRAFRSLCIGDEAVYNDSDLGAASPCSQRDRQLAFGHSWQDAEDPGREELKRGAHESFSLRVQQYEQDWVGGGPHGAETHGGPPWEGYGERTQGRVSATFQRSFVETSQQEQSLREDHVLLLTNGAAEPSAQRRRSRSRVSSLIRAFDSDRHRDGAGTDGALGEWHNDTSWDKSALMSIQRELSEFSASYQPNFTSDHYPTSDPYASRDTSFYSSASAAVSRVNSASSFARASHGQHSLCAQVNGHSNFFIHSEFSPFKVWRHHDSLAFQQQRFTNCPEFPKWYETPMYRELSQQASPQGTYGFEERGVRHPGGNFQPGVPPSPPRSTSTSTMLQKASAVEKRCESELAAQYPHRKRAQSLGTNRLPSQRPSTASPTVEMSRRVRDTISSVKALQQKIKLMTEQNVENGRTANQQGAPCSRDDVNSFGNDAVTVAPNMVRSNATHLNISQLLPASVRAHQDAETPLGRQSAASSPPVEHAPVRAESRGATPDARMSGYKSRASSLLFNLKDNRKRVKNTYSPTKFKIMDPVEKSKKPVNQEPRDFVIDMPDFPNQEIPFTHVEESSGANVASHQSGNQYQSRGSSMDSHPVTTQAGQYLEYTLSDYQTTRTPGELAHRSRLTGLMSCNEHHSTNRLANGQNLHEGLPPSFPPYKQCMMDNVETLGGDVYGLKPSYRASETTTNTVHDQTSKDNRQNYNYNSVSSQDKWRQTNSQDTETLSLEAAISPRKQERAAFIENDHHAHQRPAMRKDDVKLPRDKYGGEKQQITNKELDHNESRQSNSVGTYCYENNSSVSKQLPQHAPVTSNDAAQDHPAYYEQQQTGAITGKHACQKYRGHNEENETKENDFKQNYYRYNNEEDQNQHTLCSNKNKTTSTQETGPRKQSMPVLKGHETQSLPPVQATPELGNNMQRNILSDPDIAAAPTISKQVKDKEFPEVKAEQATAGHMKAQHAQAELAKAQHRAQVEQPKAESARLILAGQTGSEKVRAELTECGRAKQWKAEHTKEETEKTEKSTVKNTEHAGSEEKKVEQQTGVQKLTGVPRDITKEAGAPHMKEEQGERVKCDQAKSERLKEEHAKTERAKTEEATIQALQASRGVITMGKAEEKTMIAEQIKQQQTEKEQIRTVTIQEPTEKEYRKTEQCKPEQMKEHHFKTEQGKIKLGEVVKADELKAKDVRQEKSKVDSTQAGHPKPKHPTAHSSKATKQVKSEPDKVEKVKTELAKAKAELAKIKEKMREQKARVQNTVATMEEDVARKDVPSRVNMTKADDDKKHDKEADSVPSKLCRDQVDRGAEDYDSLREKYGFTLANRNEASTANNDSSNADNKKGTLSLDTDEPVSDKESKDKPASPARCSGKGIKEEEVGGLKSPDLTTEGYYVYSESSKEFKLSSPNCLGLSANVEDHAERDTVTDEAQEDSVKKLEKREAVTPADASQQRDSDVTKPVPLERKPKSVWHSAGPGKDPHFTPPRALSHKERAQAKQEILTSRIKAHAEKEISAIKEKGFAIRDGIISKNHTWHLAGSQNTNIRQRPPSQEGSKKHEAPSNITPKHHMEPAGIQVETGKSVAPNHPATIPVKNAATSGPSVDHWQKQVANEPVERNREVPEDAKQTGRYNTIADGVSAENDKKENQSGVKSPAQSKEQAPKDNQAKQDSNRGADVGKQTGGLEDSSSMPTDHLSERKEDLSEATRAPAKAVSAERVMAEKPEREHEAVAEDSAPSINFVCRGENKTSVADDSLEIMGIMVIVRERHPPENNGEQIHAEETKHSNSEFDKCPPSSGLEVDKGNKSAEDDGTAKAKDGAVQETHPTEREDQTEIDINNHSENVEDNLTPNTRQNNWSDTIGPEERITLQESSCPEARPQGETQLQDPLAEKGVPSPVAAPAENKVLAETFYKQDIANGGDDSSKMLTENSANSRREDEVKSNVEEKGSQKTLTAKSNENVAAKVENTGLNGTNDSNRADGETLMKRDVQLSLTKDGTSDLNPLKSRNVDVKSAEPQEEKKHDSTQPEPFKDTSSSQQVTANQNRRVSPKLEDTETHTGEGNHVVEDVHKDCIAVRVVPAVTEGDALTKAGEHHVGVVSSGALVADGHEKVASSNCKEKLNPSNADAGLKDFPAAGSERQVKDNLEDRLRVQQVLSSVRKLSDSLKISNRQRSTNATPGNTQSQNRRHEQAEEKGKSSDQSNAQATEGDYFQVQGAAETNNELHNFANVGEASEDVSKGREVPGLLPNKAPISNNSNKETKHEAFVLDHSTKATSETSTAGVQCQNTETEKRETEGKKLSSKQSDGPTGGQLNSEKKHIGQISPIRKQPNKSQSSLSARERRSSRNGHPAKENAIDENAEVKPKPRERVSAIPEISALADYARLKVIVSEEPEDTLQEFPPHKKEGFFPLIHTRHSRRPVFTADPKEIPVKEKKMPIKTELGAKVNKEPKALVFPITEKEHQRTGMFKLGDKEKQGKMVDAPAIVDAGAMHAQSLKEQSQSLTTNRKNQGSKAQVAGTDTQRPYQVDPTIFQSDKVVKSNPREKCEEFSSKAEPTTIFDKKPQPQPLVGLVRNMEESTTLRNNKKCEHLMTKTREERKETTRQEGPVAQHEETAAEPTVEEQSPVTEEKKRTEELRIQHIMEERRASLAEEERIAARREEERRAKEREAIAIRIKERREKQREAERKAKQMKERVAQNEEQTRAKQREEERRVEELERIKTEEERGAKVREEEARREMGRRRMRQQEEEERVPQEEQQSGARHEEQQRNAVREDQLRRAAQEEQQRRDVQGEQQRKAVLEDQRRKEDQEELQRRAAQEEQQKKDGQEEQQQRAVQEEQKRRRAAQEEQQRKAALEEQRRRAALQEEQRKAQEEQHSRVALIEKQTQAKQTEERRLPDAGEEKKKTQRGEEEGNTVIKRAKEERTRNLEESQAAEENRVAAERPTHREDEIKAPKREEEEKFAAQREKERATQMEEQKRAAQMMDALQYYAITSTDPQRKPKERRTFSPSPFQEKIHPSVREQAEESESHYRHYRPHDSASPAPSLPRSNTSSPAPGAKPSMFRVKDNTLRGSSLTKSVKPRFHKNFGEDFRVGSPMERVSEEEREVPRPGARTPIHNDTALNHRLGVMKGTSSQENSAHLPQHRPYSRRSVAMDEDDSRSVVSYMSEDVESFATSAADLADVRSLYDYDRPESACSYSSDASRSMGKPPVVPPKSEKALLRAKRLTSRRTRKETTKTAKDIHSEVGKPLQEVSGVPPSSTTEVHSSNRHALVSPHFSSPVSLAHAPTVGYGLPSSRTEPPSSHHSVHASPHATGPISLPATSPHAPRPASHTASPQTVTHVSSSPTLHHANHPAPVTQYHVESSYPQSYPLTQRKVLKDLGSGQYFVVDVPVQVKTKTFFDPETGKYVQLNVRESGPSASRAKPQQMYPPSQLHSQQQPRPQASSPGNPFVLYQGYHGYSQGHQPATIHPVPPPMSSAPVILHHNQQHPVRENPSYGHPASELRRSSTEGHRYSPEKSPYMDTVNDTEKTHNTVYNTHGSYEAFPECDTNSQLAVSSVCENDNSAHSQYQHRDIITMSELEDIMDFSDW